MKVLIYFPRRKVDIFFEGAMLEQQLRRACKREDVTVVDKLTRDVDIANFLNLNASSSVVIRHAIGLSIPTILWVFFANNDYDARLIDYKKDGKMRISSAKLELINMMDAVIVPSTEGKYLLRTLGVRVPIFVIPGASDSRNVDDLVANKTDVFRRYFRIKPSQRYTMSVLNVESKYEIEQLNLLASAVPEVQFYAFVSARNGVVDRLRLRALDRKTADNLVITKIIPEDVFRSGLINANYYIDLGLEKMSIMTTYEPMYLKVPMIFSKKAVFSDIIDKNKAYIVNDFNGAAFIIRNDMEDDRLSDNAAVYTDSVNTQTFGEAIYKLFHKIYTR